MPDTTLMEFPCAFSVRAFGKKDTDFETIVFDLIRAHAPELKREDLSHKLSRNGRYIAVTAKMTAQSKAQMDAIYRDLSNHDAVVMAL